MTKAQPNVPEVTPEEVIVVRSPPGLGDYCKFHPSERFVKKYKCPDATYVAMAIGLQKLTRQPILRVFNPYAGHVELPKQTTLPKTAIKAHLGPFELHTDLGGSKTHMSDWTVWCDEAGTWGTWEP